MKRTKRFFDQVNDRRRLKKYNNPQRYCINILINTGVKRIISLSLFHGPRGPSTHNTHKRQTRPRRNSIPQCQGASGRGRKAKAARPPG